MQRLEYDLFDDSVAVGEREGEREGGRTGREGEWPKRSSITTMGLDGRNETGTSSRERGRTSHTREDLWQGLLTM